MESNIIDILKETYKNSYGKKFNVNTKFFTFQLIKELIEKGTIILEGDPIAGAVEAQAYLSGIMAFSADILPKFYASEDSEGKLHVFNMYGIKYLIDLMSEKEIPVYFSRNFLFSGIRITIFENSKYTTEELLNFVTEYTNNF